MGSQDFPVAIHLITIPLTLAIGFVLGWVVRGMAAQPPRPPRPPREDSGA